MKTWCQNRHGVSERRSRFISCCQFLFIQTPGRRRPKPPDVGHAALCPLRRGESDGDPWTPAIRVFNKGHIAYLVSTEAPRGHARKTESGRITPQREKLNVTPCCSCFHDKFSHHDDSQSQQNLRPRSGVQSSSVQLRSTAFMFPVFCYNRKRLF